MAEQNETLDNIRSVNEIDASGMLLLVDKLPQMMEEGWNKAQSTDIPDVDGIKNIVISGMGGSAISGDIAFVTLRNISKVPIYVNRNYTCPQFVSSETLFIALSYSGNTEETLSSLKEAITKKAKIICVTSGGEVKALAGKENIPFVEIPGGLPPRAALGYLLSPLLNILSRIGIAAGIKEDFDAAIRSMKQLQRKYGVASHYRENEVKQMAVRLFKKIPVVMSVDGTTSAAGLRWKTQINENSKMTVLFTAFPELNHNDMVNFGALKTGGHNYSFVVLRDEGDTERMKRRIETTKSLISSHVGGIAEIWSQGKSAFERIMSLIIFGDYLSVYLAVLNGVDPTPVDIIERLKKELQR
jgi:glucose/mannose-6-phosphate isomerase